MVSATERTKLLNAAFRLALAAEWRLPVIVNRQAMTLGAAAVKGRAVLFNIIFRAAANQVIELAAIEIFQLDALAARAEFNARHHGAIERQPLLRRRRFDRHIRLRADHAASYIVAHRAHRD